jgi:hypothetical protein
VFNRIFVSTYTLCNIPSTQFPYWLGMMGGYCFDALAFVTRKKLPISSVRVKKFCATTQFDSTKAMSSGFVPPYTLKEGFMHPREGAVEFENEQITSCYKHHKCDN